MPSSAANSDSALGHSNPDPDAPPTISTASRSRSSGLAPHQLGRRPDQHIGRLQRLDAAGEGDHQRVGRDPQLGARREPGRPG